MAKIFQQDADGQHITCTDELGVKDALGVNQVRVWRFASAADLARFEAQFAADLAAAPAAIGAALAAAKKAGA